MESQNIKFEESADEQQISKMLGGLKRVEAPGDFDLRVRGRIAAGKPADKSSWLPVPVRLAVPLGLLLLVGGYFAFNSFYWTGNVSVPVAEVQPIIEPAPGAVKNEQVVPPSEETTARG